MTSSAQDGRGMNKAQLKLRRRMIAIWRDRHWEVPIGQDLNLSCFVYRQLNKKGFGHLRTQQVKQLISEEIFAMQRAKELDYYQFNGCCYWRMASELLEELTPKKPIKTKGQPQPHPTPDRRRHRQHRPAHAR